MYQGAIETPVKVYADDGNTPCWQPALAESRRLSGRAGSHQNRHIADRARGDRHQGPVILHVSPFFF